MKHQLLLAFPLLLVGCIQTDLEDAFPPTLRIENEITEIEFRVSGSYSLSAVYTDDSGEPQIIPIQWESSDENVISIEGNTASVHREGLTIITAKALGLTDTHTIETLPSRGSLVISGYVPAIQVGNSTPFKFNFIEVNGQTNNSINPEWSSSNEAVATIDNDGILTAISAGSTEITITLEGVGNVIDLMVVEDALTVDPVVRIVSFAQFLSIGDSFQFDADYYNEGAELVEETVTWSSSNENILSINSEGLAVAQSNGLATVTATVGNVSAMIEVSIEGEGITERTGTLMGTGYDIEGDFTLSRNMEGDLILTVENYKPDGPGPYFYLTNQNSNVVNGINLGEARTGGDYLINITEIDPSIELTTYNFLMVWCEPFNVRLGVGEFDN